MCFLLLEWFLSVIYETERRWLTEKLIVFLICPQFYFKRVIFYRESFYRVLQEGSTRLRGLRENGINK